MHQPPAPVCALLLSSQLQPPAPVCALLPPLPIEVSVGVLESLSTNNKVRIQILAGQIIFNLFVGPYGSLGGFMGLLRGPKVHNNTKKQASTTNQTTSHSRSTPVHCFFLTLMGPSGTQPDSRELYWPLAGPVRKKNSSTKNQTKLAF